MFLSRGRADRCRGGDPAMSTDLGVGSPPSTRSIISCRDCVETTRVASQGLVLPSPSKAESCQPLAGAACSSISMLIVFETSTPPVSRATFQVRSQSSRSIVVVAEKAAF